MSLHAIAHRAGNSLTGLHAANELGVDVIECDIHRHRNRLEATHLKSAGPFPFLWDRWELVPVSAPRLGLRELLEAERHGTTFMLDLKGIGTGIGAAVSRLLSTRATGGHGAVGHGQPVLVCGRNWRAVEEVAALEHVLPVLSARNSRELGALWPKLSAGNVHGVSVHNSLLDATVVARLRKHVEVVMTWPINDLVILDRMVDMGVNGIISDEPEVLAEVIARRP